MVESAKTHKKMKEIFDRGDHTIEQVLSITIIALFAFFCYMRGVRHKLQLKTTHPHPLVRAYYIRDMLATAASARWNIDMPVLERLVDERFEEFITAMEKIDLFDFTIFDREYISEVAQHCKRLIAVRQKHKESCKDWAWISWG